MVQVLVNWFAAVPAAASAKGEEVMPVLIGMLLILGAPKLVLAVLAGIAFLVLGH